MEQHDQERSWKSDPRLHHMDAKKIALLASFADELAAAPEAQRMNAAVQSGFFQRGAGSALFHPDRKSVAGWQKEGRNDPSPCRTVPAKIRRILFQQNFEKSAAGKAIRCI